MAPPLWRVFPTYSSGSSLFFDEITGYCMLERPLCQKAVTALFRPERGQHQQGIDEIAVIPHLEVQVRAGGIACIPHRADDIALVHDISLLHIILA